MRELKTLNRRLSVQILSAILVCSGHLLICLLLFGTQPKQLTDFPVVRVSSFIRHLEGGRKKKDIPPLLFIISMNFHRAAGDTHTQKKHKTIWEENA